MTNFESFQCNFPLSIIPEIGRSGRYGLLQTVENAFDNGRKTTWKKKKSLVFLNFEQYDIHARDICIFQAVFGQLVNIFWV